MKNQKVVHLARGPGVFIRAPGKTICIFSGAPKCGATARIDGQRVEAQRKGVKRSL